MLNRHRLAIPAFALLVTLPLSLPAQQVDMDAVEAMEDFRVGVQSTHRGRYHAAIVSFEKSLSLKPDISLTSEWLGLANFRSGYVEPALSIWRDLLLTDSASPTLGSRVEFVAYRRGIAPDLADPPRYATAYRIDARVDGDYAYRRPVCARALPNGTLYLTAFASNRIVVLDVNGHISALLDGGLVGYDKPFDVLPVVGGFWVSEFGGNRIALCDESGTKIRVVSEAGEYRVLGPQYLAADDRGYIYVSDAGNQVVHKFDSGGEHVLSFGGRDAVFGGLAGPTGIVVRHDMVLVAEHDGKRIRVFDTSGNYLRSLGEGTLRAPEGLALEGENTLVVADTTRVMELDLMNEVWAERGDLSSYAAKLTSVFVGINGDVFAVDMNLEKVFVLTKLTHLVSGFDVRVERINAVEFPDVRMEVSVADLEGRPIIGLKPANFVLSEAGASVPEPELIRESVDFGETEVSVLVDSGPGMVGLEPALRSSLGALRDVLDGSFHVRVIAGEQARVVSSRDAPRLRMIEAASTAGGHFGYRFDEGLRSAVREIVGAWSGRAVIYITAGSLSHDDFGAYSLSDMAAYLRNNHVGLWVIALGEEDIAAELQYLCDESGGGLLVLSRPRGLLDLPADIRNRRSGLYQFSYASTVFPDFGQRYIDVSAEVVLRTRSGRDGSGYFAPLEF